MYNAVTREYLVNTKQGGRLIESRTVRDEDELERAMTVFESFPAFTLEADRDSSRFLVRMRVDLGPGAVAGLHPLPALHRLDRVQQGPAARAGALRAAVDLRELFEQHRKDGRYVAAALVLVLAVLTLIYYLIQRGRDLPSVLVTNKVLLFVLRLRRRAAHPGHPLRPGAQPGARSGSSAASAPSARASRPSWWRPTSASRWCRCCCSSSTPASCCRARSTAGSRARCARSSSRAAPWRSRCRRRSATATIARRCGWRGGSRD